MFRVHNAPGPSLRDRFCSALVLRLKRPVPASRPEVLKSHFTDLKIELGTATTEGEHQVGGHDSGSLKYLLRC